jgi:hypothetical protein
MRAREFTINIPINIKINGDGEPEVSTADQEQDDSDLGKFVPPLQQKIELLKKSAGVDNVFDQEAADDEPLE